MKKIFLILISIVFLNNGYADNIATINEFKAAAVEYNPQFMEFKKNLPTLSDAIINAAKNGAKLIVLPETATSGYIYKDRKQITPFLDTIPGATTDMMVKIAKQYDVYIAVGIAEVDPKTNLAYNSAALVGPDGYIGKYRKTQLNSSDTKWATRGNLGYPIFQTKLGKLGLLICYDDMHLQTLLLNSLRGADVLVYLTSSDVLPKYEEGSDSNHTTIGNISSVSGWLGMYIVASNRTGNETNPLTNQTTHFVGAASIWDPFGKPLSIAPVSTLEKPSSPVTVYAEINTKHYINEVKTNWLNNRRPELYQDYAYYRAPTDPEASKSGHQINALLIQYTPKDGDVEGNYSKVDKLITNSSSLFNLVVLPYNSFIGENINKSNIKLLAENINGNSVQKAINLAKKYKTYLVFSFPEILEGKYYETALLINYKGEVIGTYRKTHLSKQEKEWATAGDNLPVFDTGIGRIAIILNDEARIPELSDIYALKRADIITLPVAFDGSYGGNLQTPAKLFVSNYPKDSQFIWFDMAKYAQSYVLVANFVHGSKSNVGLSGMYSLVPEAGFYPPVVASKSKEVAQDVNFITLTDKSLWQNQARLVIGRRDDLAIPLTWDKYSQCFASWKNNSTNVRICE